MKKLDISRTNDRPPDRARGRSISGRLQSRWEAAVLKSPWIWKKSRLWTFMWSAPHGGWVNSQVIRANGGFAQGVWDLPCGSHRCALVVSDVFLDQRCDRKDGYVGTASSTPLDICLSIKYLDIKVKI